MPRQLTITSGKVSPEGQIAPGKFVWVSSNSARARTEADPRLPLSFRRNGSIQAISKLDSGSEHTLGSEEGQSRKEDVSIVLRQVVVVS